MEKSKRDQGLTRKPKAVVLTGLAVAVLAVLGAAYWYTRGGGSEQHSGRAGFKLVGARGVMLTMRMAISEMLPLPNGV